jgi:hypothetical protein
MTSMKRSATSQWFSRSDRKVNTSTGAAGTKARAWMSKWSVVAGFKRESAYGKRRHRRRWGRRWCARSAALVI